VAGKQRSRSRDSRLRGQKRPMSAQEPRGGGKPRGKKRHKELENESKRKGCASGTLWSRSGTCKFLVKKSGRKEERRGRAFKKTESGNTSSRTRGKWGGRLDKTSEVTTKLIPKCMRTGGPKPSQKRKVGTGGLCRSDDGEPWKPIRRANGTSGRGPKRKKYKQRVLPRRKPEEKEKKEEKCPAILHTTACATMKEISRKGGCEASRRFRQGRTKKEDAKNVRGM